MSYNRTIICDIDDTISFTITRDWENALPNRPLIEKLNKLYDNGWEIIYATARGSISCSSREEAKQKYEEKILNWFKKNNVKYSKLSFMKELGMYYIDDKSITPQGFLDLNIEILKGGLSGAIVERHGDRVYKTADNSLNAAAWFNIAKNIIPCIKVHSLIGKTICMDFVEKTDEPKIDDINKYIEAFKNIPAYVPFDTYIQKVNSHFKYYNPNYIDKVNKLLNEIKPFCDENKSFCHGDFSLDNMINSNGTLYLIDPIYDPSVYSSWIVDVTKLIQNARRFKNTFVKEYYEFKYKDILKVIKVMELTHWIRMRKYSDKKEFVDENIETIFKEIEECF